MTRRKSLALLCAGAAGTFANAFCIEPSWLSVTRADIDCPLLPAALDGLRIGVLCDLHFKPGRDDSLLEAAVDKLLAEQPDIITLPGDFIDHSPRVVAPMLRILSKLSAPHGVFASPGNHDGWNMDCAILRRAFEKSGISFLINQNTREEVRGESIAIAATDHVWLGKPDPVRTLRGIHRDVPVISLVHEPDFFDTMTEFHPIALQVSGHTHGGQCKVPLFGYAPARVAYGRNYLEGAYARGSSRLFVSRGLGTTGLRVRFACPPEVAVLTLRSA
jgi:predicted MPP superfamily phosphohydrolase